MGWEQWGVAGLLMVAAAGVQAATYRCAAPDGSVQYADRPCGQTATPVAPTVGGAGPLRNVPTPRPSSQTATAMPKAPEYAAYLPPDCAQLEEASRTSYQRGLRGDTLRSVQNDFETKCEAQRRRAQERVSEERSERERQYRDRRQEERAAEAERGKTAQQCEQMRSVIADRRASGATMDARQKELLHTLQDNFNRSCLNQR
ncbi:hypothetical protein CDL60_10045 [Roseateles noduli]|nr:hypothetical protein CDL60_10045 [Roseateles noduli]